jgi:ribosomal protein S18 acetylase RimI-like enzyme
MPEIEIRPAVATDIPILIELDHNYMTDFVWQMDLHQPDEGQIQIGFREVRLPRSIRVEYPRSPRFLMVDWTQRDGLLVGVLAEEAIGYVGVRLDVAPLTTWVTDLAVNRRQRRQGVGSALLLAAQEWGLAHESRNLVLEIQPKNYPAIRMAQKLGFEFCGYNDRYFANRDIGLFFAKSLR